MTSSPGLPSSLEREQQDGLAVDGVTALLLTDVINDIQNTPHQYDPNVILDGIQRFVDVAHAQGKTVIVTTLTPYGGYERYTLEGERARQTVNAALREGTIGDAVIDFDAALRDPVRPEAIRPEFDSGDHLHPNDAGQRALTQETCRALAPQNQCAG